MPPTSKIRQPRDHKAHGIQQRAVSVIIALEAVCLSLGVTAVAGDLEYGGIVRGKIVQTGQPLPNIKVTLQDEFEQQYEPVLTNRDGVFVLTGVAPGKYKLLVWPPGGQPRKSEVIAGPEVTDIPTIDLTGAIELAVASPSPTGLPVSPGSISSDEARRFVKSFWAARERGDLDGLMAAFGPEVDYYEDGVLDQAAIRDDQKTYLRSYTQRTFDLGAIDVIKGESANSDATQVRFSFRYHVSGGKKVKSGSSSEVWLLRRMNDKAKIVDCKEKVLRD
jgi:hypothetical protein